MAIMALGSSRAAPKPVAKPKVALDAGFSECHDVLPKPQAKLIVITIDGTRWHEIFLGTEDQRTKQPHLTPAELTPNLHALGAHGAILGAPGYGTIAATGPHYISFPGYTEMLSGHKAPCQRNDCPRNTRTTVFDEAWVGGGKVAAFSSWQRIDYAVTTMENGFFRSCGDEAGQSRDDHATTEEALAYYERERPDVFFFGLAGTDEAAHHNDYDRYLANLRHADEAVGRMAKLAGPDTYIFVTADHGRSSNFRDHITDDAARVWLVASGPRIRARGEVFSPKPRFLKDIAATAREVLGLREDDDPGAGEVLDELLQTTACNEPPRDPKLPTN